MMNLIIKISLILITLISTAYTQVDCKECYYQHYRFRFTSFSYEYQGLKTRTIDIGENCTPIIDYGFLNRDRDILYDSLDLCTPLPITLHYFTGKQYSNNSVILEWETLTELNNDYFTLYRTKDGKDWLIIDTISGSGTSSEPIKYQYIEDNVSEGTQYYLLVQTDYDGTEETFDIITITISIDRKLVGIYDIFGNKVDENHKGIIIYKYDDGTYTKVLK